MSKKHLVYISSLIFVTCFLSIMMTVVLGCGAQQATNIANIGEHGMWVDCEPSWVDPDYADARFLYVELVPTSEAKANTTYTVDLYEKGELGDRSYIGWNEAELNVKTPKPARFAIRRDEYNAYSEAQDFLAGQTDLGGIPIEARDNGWWEDIFSVEIYEQNQ